MAKTTRVQNTMRSEKNDIMLKKNKRRPKWFECAELQKVLAFIPILVDYAVSIYVDVILIFIYSPFCIT